MPFGEFRGKLRKNLAIWLAGVEGRLLAGASQGEIETIAGHVADKLRGDPFCPLTSFAQSLHEKATGIPNVFSKDGEQVLLDRVPPSEIQTVFDVGANVGLWSQYALGVFAGATVHAFEIVPETFRLLFERLGKEPRFQAHSFGLSDGAGEIAVNIFSSNLLSSAFSLNGGRDVVEKIVCRVERGADVAERLGIGKIDVLKIDVEGAEGRVFAGFEPMFTEARIRLVQFEYNRGAIVGNFLLKDAYEFFVPRGYVLGKLTPEGVRFHDYELAHEDFRGPNYVACRKGDEKMIAAIGCRS